MFNLRKLALLGLLPLALAGCRQDMHDQPRFKPLRMVMTSGMGPQAFTRTSEVVEVTEKAPPADVLTVPEGFKQAAPPSFDAVRGPRGAPRQ